MNESLQHRFAIRTRRCRFSTCRGVRGQTAPACTTSWFLSLASPVVHSRRYDKVDYTLTDDERERVLKGPTSSPPSTGLTAAVARDRGEALVLMGTTPGAGQCASTTMPLRVSPPLATAVPVYLRMRRRTSSTNRRGRLCAQPSGDRDFQAPTWSAHGAWGEVLGHTNHFSARADARNKLTRRRGRTR